MMEKRSEGKAAWKLQHGSQTQASTRQEDGIVVPGRRNYSGEAEGSFLSLAQQKAAQSQGPSKRLQLN